MCKHPIISLFIGLLAACLLGASATAPPIAPALAPAPLAGHWTARVPMGESDTVQLAVDLATLDSRWVGEFDVPEFEVQDYPTIVLVTDSRVELRFASAGAAFKGRLAADGQRLSGTFYFDSDSLAGELHRTGEAQFSPGFWALEAAAEDSTRVTRLAADGAELRRQFNVDRDRTRLVMLLSPS